MGLKRGFFLTFDALIALSVILIGVYALSTISPSRVASNVNYEQMHYTKSYVPAAKDDAVLDKIVKRYLREIAGYTSAKIKERAVDKAIKSWKKELKLNNIPFPSRHKFC